MLQPDPVVLSLDERPAIASVDRANKSIDGYSKSVVVANQTAGKSFQSQADIVARASGQNLSWMARQNAMMEQQSAGYGRAERAALSFGRGVYTGLSAAGRGALFLGDSVARVDRDLVAIKHTFESGVGAVVAWTAAVAAGTATASAHGVAVENVVNSYRVWELATHPTLFTASFIGLAILTEHLASMTLAQAKVNEQQAIFSARNKISISDTQQLQVAVKNVSGDINTLATAYNAFQVKSGTAGLSAFGEELKRLGDIRDPVERVRETFKEFGSDVGEKLLPQLNARFRENAEQIKAWGIGLDQNSRENIQTFKDDVRSLGDPFAQVADRVHVAGAKLKEELTDVFSAVYVEAKHNIGLATYVIDNLISRMDDLSHRGIGAAPSGLQSLSGVVSPGGIDTDRALREVLSRNSATFGRNIIGAGSQFEKSAAAYNNAGARDREAAQLSERLSTERRFLFPTRHEQDEIDKQYGKSVNLDPATRALTLQSFAQTKGRLDQINKEKSDEAEKAKALLDAQTAAEAAAKALLSATKSLQQRVQDLGAGPTQLLENQRTRALAEFGQKPGSTLDKLYLDLIRNTAKQEGTRTAEADQKREDFFVNGARFPQTNLYSDFNFGIKRRIEEDAKEFHEKTAADRAIATIGLETERSGLERSASRAQRISGLEIDNPRNAAQAAYRIQLELADKLYDADIRRSLLEDDINKRRVDEAKARADFQKATDDAAVERQLKLAEIEHQRGDEFKKTFAEGALAIQHRDIGGFLKSQASGLESKVLENAGGMIFDKFKGSLSGTGVDANSTLGKLLEGTWFGSKGDKIPIVNSTFGPAVPVVVVNQSGTQPGTTGGALHVPGVGLLPRSVLSAVLAAGGAIGGGTGASAIPAGAIDSTIRYAADSGNLAQSFTGGVPGSFQSLGGLLGGPGGTSGFAGPVSGLGGGSTGGIGGILGGGGASSGGLGGLGGILSGGLSGLKGLFGSLGGGVFTNPGGGVAAGGGFGTTLGGLGSSPAAGLLGGGLAFDGLRRGGIGGLFETTAGGALLGFKFGGPIGAAIGAAAGAAAGGLRMLFKTGTEQVQQQVKEAYGVSISKQMAKQILDISNQRYGGQIHVAIRSKEVLELLSLYSQSTGQAKQFGLLNTARAGNLQSQNGTLFQQGSYENGSLVGLQSSLPSLQPFSAVAPIGTGTDRVYGPGTSGPATLHIDSSQVSGFVGNGMNSAASQSYNRLQYASLQLAPETLVR